MAVPTFVAAGTVGQNASGTGNPTAPGIPAGTIAGHLLVCFVVSVDNVVSTVAGFTNVPGLTGTNGSLQRFAVFYKWAVGGDTAPAVTHAAGNSCSAVIIGVSGAAPGVGNPFAVLGTPSLNASSSTCTALGITPAGANDLAFWFGVSSQAGTSSTVTFAAASGTNPTFTERIDNANVNGTNEVDFAIDTGPVNTGAATGNRTSAMVPVPTVNMGVMFTVNDVGPAVSTPAFVSPNPLLAMLQQGGYKRALALMLARPVGIIPIASGQTIAVGQANETDTSQQVNWAPKARLVNQVTETDTSQPITKKKTKAVGQSTETDIAQPVAWAPKKRLVAQSIETDTSQPINRVKTKVIGQALETDTSQPITRRKTKLIGQATETDIAQPITASGNKIIAVGQASETDVSQSITKVKTKAIGQDTETDTAQAVTRNKTKTLGQSTEVDASQPIAHKRTYTLGQASESSLAQAITRRKLKAIGINLETDTARPIVRLTSSPPLHDFCQAHIVEFTTIASPTLVSVVNITSSTQSVGSITQLLTSGAIGQFTTKGTPGTPVQVAGVPVFVTKVNSGFSVVVLIDQKSQKVSNITDFKTKTIEGYRIIVIVNESVEHITNLNQIVTNAISQYLGKPTVVETIDKSNVVDHKESVSITPNAVTGVTIIP